MTSITGPLFAGGCIESSSSSTVLKQQDHMMLLNEGGSLQQSGAKRNSLSSASGGAHSTASSRSSSIKSNRGLGTNNKQHSPTSSTNSNNIYYTNEIENVTQCSLCKKKLREPKLLDCLHVYCKSCLASIAQPSSGMVEASSNQHHHLMMPSPPSSGSSSTSHTPNQLPPASIALISPTPSSSSTSSASSVSSASHLVISCPKCKQDTITKSVESLENDYVMNNILDMKAMDEQALKCLSCTNDQIAMARCSDCACFLCVACVKAHKYMVCFHDHVVLEFAQIQSQYAANLARHQQQQQPHKSASACDLLAPIGHRSLSPNQNETQESASSTSLVPIHRPLNCRFHAKEALKFFCNTCQMPVCSECVISEHTQPTHVYERLGDVELARHADEIEAYVRKALEMCSSSSGHDENNSASLEKNITYLDEQMQSAREAIEETYETFKSMLDKRRNIMLNELEDRFKDKQTKLIEMHAQIDASMAKLNDVIKFAERVMQNGNSTEILLMKRAIVNQIRFLVRSLPPNNDLEATLDLNIRFGSDESRFERALVDTFGRFYTQKEIKHSYLNNLANMSNAMLNGSGSANSLIAADRDRDSLSFQQQQQQQQQFSISRQQQLQQQQQLANLQQLQQHIQQQIGSNGMNTSPRNGQAENFFDPEWQALVIQAQQQQQQQQGANQQQMKPPLLDDQLLTLKVLAQQLSASSNEECFANMMKLNNDVAKLAISPPSSSVGLTQQQHVKTMWPTSSSAASSSASSTTSSKFIMNSGGSQSGSNQHSRTHTPAPQIGNQLTMDEMMLMQFSSSAGSSSSSSSSAAPMASNPIAAQNFTQLSKFMSTTTTTATNNLPPGGLVPQPHHHHPLISPTGANMNINDLASLGSTIDLNSLSAVGFTNAYMQAMAMSNNGVDQQLQSSSQSPPLLSTNGAANPVGAIGSCIPSSTHSASSSVATVTASTAAVNGQYSGNGNLNPPVRQTAKMTNMQIRTKFGILGAGKAQFNAPHGFCLGVDEEIIVADTNNHRIQIFDKNGEWKFMFGSPGRDEGQLWYPRKVAVMRESGKFVVCDRGNERSRMQIFNKSGHFIKKISIRYIDIVAGLGITSNGEIVAVDSVSPTVFRISENGDLLKWFDCSDYMREPSDIAIWGNEYYVCDFKGHCVVVFNEDGSFVRRIGGENITNFPNGIDVSDQGDVLVGDSHGNRFHVAVFAPKGDLISEFECPYVKVSRCCGLKITSEGYVVTLAKNNHHVLVLNTLYVG